MKPRISVIMSIYKEPIEWIRLAVDSILNQTYNDFEFIIVCDNPNYSEGMSLVSEYANKDSRIVFIVNEENIGLTKSLNRAIAISQGEYIARMDADDISLPDRFNVQMSCLDTNYAYDVCTPLINVIDESSNIVMYSCNSDAKHVQSSLIWECNIAHPGVMMRRSVLRLRTPLYNERYRTSQDYELWTFLTLNGIKIKYLDETLLNYRHSSQQVGNSRRQEQFNNFKLIRRTFITRYLDPMGESLNIQSTAQEVLTYSKHHRKTADQEYYDKILYLIFYTLARENRFFYFKYIIQSGFPVFRLKLYYLSALTKLLWRKVSLPKFEY